MIYGCIDIGSNTTRLLVSARDRPEGPMRELAAERSFTRIGASLEGGSIPAEKIAETAAVAGAQAHLARELGAGAVVAVATAAVRDAANRRELVAAVEDTTGVTLRVLEGEEEARLSFLGATRTLPDPATRTVAVVDVGGGSTEIAVGEPDGTVEWSRSLRLGSGSLADAHLRCDPPAATELEAVRAEVSELCDLLAPPAARMAVAVGGTATSLHRLVGGRLDERSLDEGVRVLSASRIADVAARFDLDPERVRLLPAGIIVLGAVSRCLGLALEIARGGLREGVILELMDGAETGSA